MKNTVQLQPEKVINTIEKLRSRIDDRFPDSSLKEVCDSFLKFSQKSKKNITWISTPNFWIRGGTYFIISIGLIGIIYSISLVDLEIQNTKLAHLVTMFESIINDIILVGAAIFFLTTIETRIKRNRAIKSLNELRVLAHVVDMHQLTKDPSLINSTKYNTSNSPERTLTVFELERYLDYCSELTSLIAKIAVLYAQGLPDQVVVRTVNEIETLCTGLCRKIWQKLIILNEKRWEQEAE